MPDPSTPAIFPIFDFLKETISAVFNLYNKSPALFWHKCLFISFWLSLAFFPIGYGFREVTPLICLIFLALYYRVAYGASNLAKLGKLKWLFFSVGCMILCGVIFSIHPWASFLHAGMGINKAYILPFIAMECVRGLKELRLLCWACVFAIFWQGLDGLWQAYTGADFIMGYTHIGRLTGSLGDYTVGNYLALAMPPAFGCWFILRKAFSLGVVSLLIIALFWPAIFLFLGASSRSALLAICGSLMLWAIMRHGVRHGAVILMPCAAIAIFLFFEGSRFSLAAITGDNRWDLWHLGWAVFLAHPWFGAGAGQYNAAFQALGLAPLREVITISHPHNLYIDMLYAHGVIGFAMGMAFIAGFAIWLWRNIQPHIRNLSHASNLDEYWQLTAWFFLGYVAWLFNGIFGHDFYRIWWLALAMCNLGIAIGAVLNARQKR